MIKDKGDEFLDKINRKVTKVDDFINELDHGLKDFELFWDFIEELIKMIVLDFG